MSNERHSYFFEQTPLTQSSKNITLMENPQENFSKENPQENPFGNFFTERIEESERYNENLINTARELGSYDPTAKQLSKSEFLKSKSMKFSKTIVYPTFDIEDYRYFAGFDEDGEISLKVLVKYECKFEDGILTVNHSRTADNGNECRETLKETITKKLETENNVATWHIRQSVGSLLKLKIIPKNDVIEKVWFTYNGQIFGYFKKINSSRGIKFVPDIYVECQLVMFNFISLHIQFSENTQHSEQKFKMKVLGSLISVPSVLHCCQRKLSNGEFLIIKSGGICLSDEPMKIDTKEIVAVPQQCYNAPLMISRNGNRVAIGGTPNKWIYPEGNFENPIFVPDEFDKMGCTQRVDWISILIVSDNEEMRPQDIFENFKEESLDSRWTGWSFHSNKNLGESADSENNWSVWEPYSNGIKYSDHSTFKFAKTVCVKKRFCSRNM
jgi:hypothetical protein